MEGYQSSCNIQHRNHYTLAATNIENVLNMLYESLLYQIDDFETRDSGWSLLALVTLELNIIEFVPLRGSSYIETPEELAKRRAIVNIHNLEQKCFVKSINASQHPVKENPEGPTQYEKYENDLNIEGISYSVSIKDIDKFEAQKPRVLNQCVWIYKF